MDYDRLKTLTQSRDADAARLLVTEATRRSLWDDAIDALNVLRELEMKRVDYQVVHSVSKTFIKVALPLGMLGRAAGRVYPANVMAQAVEEYQATIVQGRAWGELGSPDPSGVVHLSHASHLVTKMAVEEEALVMTLEVLDTEKGAMLKEYLKAVPDAPVSMHVNGRGDVRNGMVENFSLLSVSVKLTQEMPTFVTKGRL